MSRKSISYVAATALIGIQSIAWAASPPGLSTSYNHKDGSSSVNWLTCGRTATSEGCYGAGQIGPFQHPCAVINQGDDVYIAEAHFDSERSMSIGVYRQTVSTSPSVAFVKTIEIPQAGSTAAQCYMASDGNNIFFGTDQSGVFYEFRRDTGKVMIHSICGTPTKGIYATGFNVLIDQGVCAGYFTKGKMTMSGGNDGQSFFPNGSAAVLLK